MTQKNEIIGLATGMLLLANIVGIIIASVKENNRKTELHNNVEKFRTALPSYQDTLATLDKKYGDSVFVWTDAVNNSDDVTKRNAAAQKLGYYWAEREKLVAKHDSVSNLVQRYHNSLYSKQK